MGNVGNTATDTGIPVTAGARGETLLALCSSHYSTSSGYKTTASLFLIRLSYDGDDISASEIVSGGAGSFSFSVSGNNTLTITGGHNSSRVKIISNK